VNDNTKSPEHERPMADEDFIDMDALKFSNKMNAVMENEGSRNSIGKKSPKASSNSRSINFKFVANALKRSTVIS
jgi:hypothetical protein